jgi:antitoxin HicB
MLELGYPAVFTPERQGGFSVSFPDLPEAHTGGDDRADATLQALDCLMCALSYRITDGEDIPRPSAPKRGQYLVSVPLWLAPKVALYQAMREQKVSNVALARKLKCSENVIRRMLNPKHGTKPEKIQRALEALGKRLTVSVRDAA